MSLERPQSDKRSGILEAGLVAMSLLGAHDEVRAAEIAPTATWEQGVSELRRSVMQEPVEYAASGAVLQTGTMAWPRTIKGEIDGVRARYRKTVLELKGLADGTPMRNYCDIHTHPAESISREFDIPNAGDKAYAPPSFFDASLVPVRQSIIPEFASENGLEIKQVTAAVFDPHGIWYYRALSKTERQQHGTVDKPYAYDGQESFVQEIQTPFTQSSALPDFNFKVEYEKLRSAYRQRLATEIRFVSYDELSNEPPCAGPDYKPENK